MVEQHIEEEDEEVEATLQDDAEGQEEHATVESPPAIDVPRAEDITTARQEERPNDTSLRPFVTARSRLEDSEHGQQTQLPGTGEHPRIPRDNAAARPESAPEPPTDSRPSSQFQQSNGKPDRSVSTLPQNNNTANASTPGLRSEPSLASKLRQGSASRAATLQTTRTQQFGATSGRRTWSSARSKLTRRESDGSFMTARETLSESRTASALDKNGLHKIIMDGQADESDPNRASTVGTESQTDSTTALLAKDAGECGHRDDSARPQHNSSSLKSPDKSTRFENNTDTPLADAMAHSSGHLTASGLVRFDLPEDDSSKHELLKMRLAQNRRRDTFKRLRRGKAPQGEIIKMEKMLVRIEYTVQEVPPDYDENGSQRTDSRVLDKWREFMVVCREATTDDTEFVLQLYKSRVIPATEKTHVRKRFAHGINLDQKSTKLNIFSSLDKTVVLWEPYRKGTRMYIMKPRSGASAMEWFTFLRGLLGWDRSSLLQINIPDLAISLRLDHPFENLENSQNLVKASQGDEEALEKTIQEEQAAAQNLVVRCVGMLEKSPDWGSIIDEWAMPTDFGAKANGSAEVSRVKTNVNPMLARPATAGSANSKRSTISQINGHRPVGLAWKRYDRLEWVHGANEKSMYGTIGMEKFHDLELRPKQHYPTSVHNQQGETLIEPPPVEGFLIRLTSQKGTEQKLGKLFFKRLYFSTHSQFLVFNRPAQADPPPPPKLPMTENSHKIPSAHEIAETVPLIYAINPYPLHENQIAWLDEEEDIASSPESVIRHDTDAFDENERKINLILKSDGLINLTNVISVRKTHRGATPADDNIHQGSDSDVDFNQDVEDSRHEDGTTQQMDDARTFELVLKNGMIVRLQAYDKTTRHEWMTRLRHLIAYWTLRTAADMNLYKSVRASNLAALRIDEEEEAYVGQFAHKWEVSHSVASPELYHMCGIACCRSVMMSGTLFRKPRMHASFARVQVVLSHGHLLVFQDAVRTRSGKLLQHIHHERVTAIELAECYIYSGLITAGDMLYSAADGYEKARPGVQGGLPRMYVGDGWSSTDEDTMTCFVIWHGKRKGWFRSEAASKGTGAGSTGKIKRLGQLGKEGHSVSSSCVGCGMWWKCLLTHCRLFSRQDRGLRGTTGS